MTTTNRPSLLPTASEQLVLADELLLSAHDVMDLHSDMAKESERSLDASRAGNIGINITAARMAVARALVLTQDFERLTKQEAGDE